MRSSPCSRRKLGCMCKVVRVGSLPMITITSGERKSRGYQYSYRAQEVGRAEPTKGGPRRVATPGIIILPVQPLEGGRLVDRDRRSPILIFALGRGATVKE